MACYLEYAKPHTTTLEGVDGVQIELRNFPLPVRAILIKSLDGMGEARLMVEVSVWDRSDPNSQIKLSSCCYVSRDEVTYPTRLSRRLLAVLVDTLAHEVAECIYVNGERIYDPHAKE